MLSGSVFPLAGLILQLAAYDGFTPDCRADFDAALANYERAIADARDGANAARKALADGDRETCRQVRFWSMSAANHVTKYWNEMKALHDNPGCKQQLPALPAFNSWPYKDMGFGYGEAGFILFKPLHCGL
jgi:hypothetical protein